MGSEMCIRDSSVDKLFEGVEDEIDLYFCQDSQLVDFENGASGSDPCFSSIALTVLVAGTSFRVNFSLAPSSELTLAFRLPDDLLRRR